MSVCVITLTVSMIKHTLYLWHHIYCIYGTIFTLSDISPRFMTSQHSTHDIRAIISHLKPIISDSTSTVSLLSQPDYLSYNPHCMYDNTATIRMTSYKLHMTSHPLFMISHHSMTSQPLYSCHHIQDTCHCIHCSPTNIIVYWLYHTYYMCDMKPTICMTSQEFYMTSHSLFMT